MIQIWDLRMFFFEMGGSTISYSQPGFNWVQSCSKFYMMSGSQNLIKIRRFVCVCDSWIFSPSIRSGMVLIVGVVWLGSFRGMDFIDVGDYARKQRFCARFNLLTHQNWQWLHGNTYNVSLCTYNYHAKWGSHIGVFHLRLSAIVMLGAATVMLAFWRFSLTRRLRLAHHFFLLKVGISSTWNT